MNRSRRTTLLGSALVAAIAAGAGLTIAQQPATQPAQPATGQPPLQDQPKAPPTPEQERAALKARLERRLADSKANQERYEAALKRLESGASAHDVLTSVEPGGRFGRGGGGGGPGGQQGPTGDHGQGGPGGQRGGWRGSGKGPGEQSGMPPAPGSGQAMDREAILAFMDRNNPDMAARFRTALKDNPAAGERLIARMEPHIRELQAEKDPEMRSLRLTEMQNGWEVMSTGRQLTESLRKKAPDQEQSQIRARLAELVGQHFDLQVKLHEREIASLETRIAQLRSEMSDQLSKRDSYITERVDQITKFAQDRATRPERDPGHPDPNHPDQPRPPHDDAKQPNPKGR